MKKSILIVLFLIFIISDICLSQVNQEWVKLYNGPGNAHEYAKSIATDNLGNIYVLCESVGNGTGKDFALVKYNNLGTEQWIKRYNGTGNDSDIPTAMVVANNFIYVTGSSFTTNIDLDFLTIKYDTDGNEIWIKNYDNSGTGAGDAATSLAVDNSGNVYVTGRSVRGGWPYSEDYATIKYNTDGDQIWVRRYDAGSDTLHNTGDYPYAITVDNQGDVYVTGGSYFYYGISGGTKLIETTQL